MARAQGCCQRGQYRRISVARALATASTLSARVALAAPTRCMMVASGVMTGRPRPCAARRHRSASSPYIQNRSSNPSSARHSAVRISSRHPTTMSTSRTLSRAQGPIASASNRAVRLNRAVSPVARQNALQGVMRFQHDAMFSEPSGKTVRPP